MALGMAIVPLVAFLSFKKKKKKKCFSLFPHPRKHFIGRIRKNQVTEMGASAISNLQLWWPQENNWESGWPVLFLFRKSTPSYLSLKAFLSFLLAPLPLKKKKDKRVFVQGYLVNKDF